MADKGRRGFFKKIIIGGATLYVSGWWFFKVRKGDATDYIKSVLKKHLGYLKLDEDGVNRFAIDFQERTSSKKRYWASWIGMISPVYSLFDMVKLLVEQGKAIITLKETTKEKNEIIYNYLHLKKEAKGELPRFLRLLL